MAEDWPQGALTVRLAGQAITGRSVSLTVTMNEQVALAPTESLARHVTIVLPIGKVDPDAGVLVTSTQRVFGLLAETEKFTIAEHCPTAAFTTISAGQLMVGAGTGSSFSE